jgi:hypothetical protein
MCPQPATLHITEGRTADRIEEIHLCEECAHHYLFQQHPQAEKTAWKPPSDAKRSEAIQSATMKVGVVTTPPFGSRLASGPASRETHLRLYRIIISELHEEQVMMLKEVDGERSFSIMIGIFEATSMDRTYRQLPSPRPLAHDAWLASLIAVGCSVQAACIKELREHTYYAVLRLV